MGNQYTVLDFDETLYKKDSLVAFHLFCVKQNPLLLLWFPLQFIAFLLHKMGLISTQRFKNTYLLFLSFYSVQTIENVAAKFWEKEHAEGFNDELLDIVNTNEDVVVITASPLIYFREVMERFPRTVFIGTELKRVGWFYIIDGKNCKGPEKLVRFYHYFGNNAVIHSAYSDSLSDQPLFDAAQHAFLIEKGAIKQLH
jgi:phosphoserine phosphatase